MNWLRRIIAGIIALTAVSAYAQPAVYTDLGTHTSSETFSQNVTLVAANDIQWFRIELPAVVALDGWVDIWNSPSGFADNITDSEIGIYDDFGTLIASDDDDGPSLYSALSFGQTSPVRPATPPFPSTTVGVAFNGRDGGLAGGVYWVAVGRFSVTFAAGWTVTSTYTGTQRTTVLNFAIQPSGAPIPPTGVGSANPTSGYAGSQFTATVVVSPGLNPPSTGLAVVVDASSIGGGSVNLTDNGGNSFSGIVNVAPGTPAMLYSLPFTVSDAEARSSTGSISFTVIPDSEYVEQGDADDTPDGAPVVSGSGPLTGIRGNFINVGDADVYFINICDAASFSASTVGQTTQDTQLFIFNDQAFGVVLNDDAPSGTLQSTISSAFIPGNGNYFLAVSRYDNDPIDAGGLELWLDTPFNVERQPDGAGAANPWVDFNSVSTTAGGAYRIALTGACFVDEGGGCSGDLDGDNDRDISDLAILLSQFGLTGGTFSADVDEDGDVDISDLAIMLSVFGIPC